MPNIIATCYQQSRIRNASQPAFCFIQPNVSSEDALSSTRQNQLLFLCGANICATFNRLLSFLDFFFIVFYGTVSEIGCCLANFLQQD